MKTIRQSKVVRTWNGHCRVGDIVIFDVLGAAPRGSGATEAQPLATLYKAFNRRVHQPGTIRNASPLKSSYGILRVSATHKTYYGKGKAPPPPVVTKG